MQLLHVKVAAMDLSKSTIVGRRHLCLESAELNKQSPLAPAASRAAIDAIIQVSETQDYATVLAAPKTDQYDQGPDGPSRPECSPVDTRPLCPFLS